MYDGAGDGPVKAAGGLSTNAGYGTFYPESSSTYSSPPVSSSSSAKGQSYRTMPPPADQESPYSYGYGDEKKKMLTQGHSEGQGEGYSMYSTAYPSSVTGGQGYNNYGKEYWKGTEFYPVTVVICLHLKTVFSAGK